MTYSEKLKDPRWQKKRLEVLEKASWTCSYCHSDKKTLHVHHPFYEKGKDPWDYETDVLYCLCNFCHSERQKFELQVLKAMSAIDIGSLIYLSDNIIPLIREKGLLQASEEMGISCL